MLKSKIINNENFRSLKNQQIENVARNKSISQMIKKNKKQIIMH